jgi:hypothetical protein
MTFTPIRHHLAFPLSVSVSLLPSSTFCSLFVFQASSTFLQLTQPSATLWLDQIRLSVFFAFLRPSSTLPIFFKVYQPSSAFPDLQ